MTKLTSDPGRAYVWTWLPDHTEPVVAGVVRQRGDLMTFQYGKTYLDRPDAISLYRPELPLRSGWIEPGDTLSMAGCLRDGSPDAWGRRVIESRFGVPENSLTEISYLLASGTNRFGAIDFQESPTNYETREGHATLAELQRAAELLGAGQLLNPALSEALVHGTSIGGARPKVLITDDQSEQWIAKLSARSDILPVVNAEATALQLAEAAGLRVPRSQVIRSLGRDVLLVRRFDRPAPGQRLHVVSGLTMAGEDEMAARYVTYPDLLDVLRAQSDRPETVGPELFERIVFNIAISNSDDHARNHAAFWDGKNVALTPAYDLAPGNRSGDIATQAMAIDRNGNRTSTFGTCLNAAGVYGLTTFQAREVIDRVVTAIHDEWEIAADRSRLSELDRGRLWGRQFLNPAASYDLPRATAVTLPGPSLRRPRDDESGPPPR